MTDGILSDSEIEAAVKNEDIFIDPYNPKHVNPVSYDLTLGRGVVVYASWVRPWANLLGAEDGSRFEPLSGILDVKERPVLHEYRIDPSLGWVLKPGIGYLMHTQEIIRTHKYEPVLDGKSSVGRLFIQTHCTAGYGDPGFSGQYTLEVLVRHTVRVYPGMRIAQIRFHTISGDIARPYDGNYKGADATGAVVSKCWKQFV